MWRMTNQPISGHVYRHEAPRGPVWRAKYRLPDGRQVHRTIGPAWTDRGRPRAGFFTKRTAQAWLRDVLDQARAGVLPGMVRTGVFAHSSRHLTLHDHEEVGSSDPRGARAEKTIVARDREQVETAAAATKSRALRARRRELGRAYARPRGSRGSRLERAQGECAVCCPARQAPVSPSDS